MDTPLNAAAISVGSVFSASKFEVPPYQREYSWQKEEVTEFFEDLQRTLDDDNYFVGLIILTDEEERKKIVDGQQRIVTLTLLAAALYHEAKSRGRNALADSIASSFLYSINYDTDGNDPRVVLTDPADDATLQRIIKTGQIYIDSNADTVSTEISNSFSYLRKQLSEDLSPDPFKRLGKWTEFITHKLYFAVFIHPDPASAYQVFEVINTRGRDLTTADLLKNYTISQYPLDQRTSVYNRWKAVSENFQTDGANFVQYLRHVVTVKSGHILPKDLFSFLASRSKHGQRQPPNNIEFLNLIEDRLPLYMQMMDPSLPGPASSFALGVFGALNRLNVITIRPLMMAIIDTQDGNDGLNELLRLVTRRVVVGNLGTGNIERRFAEAARRVQQLGGWQIPLMELSDLNPPRESFNEAVQRRTLNKNTLSYLKNSVCALSITPTRYFSLHFVIPRATKNHPNFSDGELAYWGNTIGNTFLSSVEGRLGEATWADFRSKMLSQAAPGELTQDLETYAVWNANSIREMGLKISQIATDLWYE